MTPDKMPALPEPIGEIVGTRGEEGTSEFFGYFADDYVTSEKQRVFTADQMHAYAAAAIAQFKEDAERWRFYDEHAQHTYDGQQLGEWLIYDAVMQLGSRSAAIDDARDAARKAKL